MGSSKKKNRKELQLAANLLGWYGAIATLVAYFLVSFEIMAPRDLTYQFLNLTGAVGLGILCYTKRAYQPFFVNTIWALVAILAVINILLFLN